MGTMVRLLDDIWADMVIKIQMNRKEQWEKIEKFLMVMTTWIEGLQVKNEKEYLSTPAVFD
jgi:hypothetical protein